MMRGKRERFAIGQAFSFNIIEYLSAREIN